MTSLPSRTGTDGVERFVIGDLVHYHPVIGGPHDGEVYEVRHGPSSTAAGVVCYWLRGKAGCVAAEALSPLEVAR